MARRFTAASGDVLDLAVGGLSSFTMSGATIVTMVRRASTGTAMELFTSYTTGRVGRGSIYIDGPTSQLSIYNVADGTFPSCSITVSNTEGWVIVGVSKAAGSATPRGHKWVAATGTSSHANMTSTQADWSTPGASGSFGLSDFGAGEYFDGEVAAVAVFPTVLTDSQFESLQAGLGAWLAYAPSLLVVPDQAAVTQTVRDWAGTSHQSARTGTTVGTNSPPLSYGGTILAAYAADAGGSVPVTQTDTGSGADALTTTAATTVTDTGSGADALTIAATLAVTADTGSGADTLGVAWPTSDTGAGTDALAVAAAIPASDTGTGSDALGIATTLTDTGTGVDALAVSVAVALVADTGSGADVLSIRWTTTDTGSGADTLTTAATIALAGDTGTSSETLTIRVTLTDTGTGVDVMSASTSTVPVTLTGDTGTAADALAVRVIQTDSGAGTDALGVVATTALASDTATSSESLTIRVLLTDTATGNDTMAATAMAAPTALGPIVRWREPTAVSWRAPVSPIRWREPATTSRSS